MSRAADPAQALVAPGKTRPIPAPHTGDAGSRHDIPAYLQRLGHSVRPLEESAARLSLLLVVGAGHHDVTRPRAAPFHPDDTVKNQGSLDVRCIEALVSDPFFRPDAVALFLLLVFCFAVLWLFGNLLAPLLVAVVMAYLLEWPVSRLQRTGLSRPWPPAWCCCCFSL